MRLHHAVIAVCAFAVSACAGTPQQVAMPPPHDPNDYPNPYHVEEGWAKLGRKFGGISAIDMDPNGKNVWVFERCGLPDDGCAKDKTLDPVLEFDSTGKLVRSWGKGEILYPHGIFVSRDRIDGHVVGVLVRDQDGRDAGQGHESAGKENRAASKPRCCPCSRKSPPAPRAPSPSRGAWRAHRRRHRLAPRR